MEKPKRHFLWDLHWNLESPQTNKPNASNVLTIVGLLDGTVNNPASATLPDTNVNARFVNKDHISAQGFLGAGCGSDDGIVCVHDSDHPTFKLVRSFLENGSLDCGPGCFTDLPSSRGNLFLRFVEQSPPALPNQAIPVNTIAGNRVVTFDPISIPNAGFHAGQSYGTLYITDLPAGGSIPLTIHGDRFEVFSPTYKDRVISSGQINRGRTTVLPQEALERIADLYTVILSSTRNVYEAGKDLFLLFVHLCCTVQTTNPGLPAGVNAGAANAAASLVDGYIWVEIPGGGRFFLMPDFTNFTEVRIPVVRSLPIQNFAGPILSMPIPDFLSLGTYTFFAVGVLPGGDPLNSVHWMTNRTQLSVTLTK